MRINTAYTLFGLLPVCLAGAVITSCRGIEPITPSTGNEVTGGSEAGEVKGFFLLNEGNMGSNKATLDYFDYATGVYRPSSSGTWAMTSASTGAGSTPSSTAPTSWRSWTWRPPGT